MKGIQRASQSKAAPGISAACWLVIFLAGVSGVHGEVSSDWQSKWYGVQDADRDIAHYFGRRVREKVSELRRRWSPRQFIKDADKIRKSLRATYLMPEVKWNGESQLIRESTIDGIATETRLLRVLPGVYSTLRICRPASGGHERHPAMLFLAGHGEAPWHPVIQKRLLGFAKQGYVAATSDPFGQGELTDTPFWNEYHGCGAMAYLLTTGQSLLGIIMASRTVEVSYLCSRSDVNPEQVVVTGGSMGGTHTLWLSAIDERVKAAVPVSAAPAIDPGWNLRMHCLCDSMVGAYNVADGEIIRSLIAPRPLLVIYPDLEAPVTDEGAMLMNEGKLDFMDKAAKSKYFLTAQQMANIYPFAREVYDQENASGRFKEVVVEGPHGDAQQYHELAYGWFAHFLMGRETTTPIPEARHSPLQDPASAKAALLAWPDGNRPSDFLGPTKYTKRAISALVAKLPAPPTTPENARRLGAKLKQRVSALLGVRLIQRDSRCSNVGELNVDGVMASKYDVEPEPGAIVHALVFRPTSGVNPNARLYVLLDPQGVKATAGSADRKRFTDNGSWVVCAELRGMGSTFDTQAAYVGIHDQPLCVGALKLGETVAGWRAQDLLAVVSAARKIAGSKVKVIVRGRRETGLVAILAASLGQSIDAVETEELLTSYDSPSGYGFPYVYGDPGRHNADLHVYGSMLPCIPDILKAADIPQIAALVCPRPLTISNPLWANGERLSTRDLQTAFAWTRQFYEASGCPNNLVINRGNASFP